MNKLQTAATLLSGVEGQITDLVSRALRDGDFSDARVLVDALAMVASAKSLVGWEALPADPAQSASANPVNVAMPEPKDNLPLQSEVMEQAPAAPKRHALSYPIFERDNDRLVKVGWSPKDRQTYEHRVGRETVEMVCQHLGKTVRPKRPFKMEQLLPILNSQGQEIPSYQGYLVLKWLQSLGAVERRGNDGYVIKSNFSSAADVEALWSRTSERATP